MSLTDLNGLLSEGDRSFLPYFVADRLADNRDPDECHCILRFCQQLMWGGCQVTLEYLRESVHEPKLAAIEDLIAAIRSDGIEAWFLWADDAFPARGRPDPDPAPDLDEERQAGP